MEELILSLSIIWVLGMKFSIRLGSKFLYGLRHLIPTLGPFY